MKVLHVLNELKPSGAEVMLKVSGHLWAGHDLQCDVLSTGPKVGAYAPLLEAAGYGVHHLPSSFSPAYFHSFHRFVREGRYAIVHQHAEGMSYWFGLAAMLAGAKVVRTVHNNFSFTGQLRLRRSLQRKHLQCLGGRFVAIAPGVQRNEAERFGTSPQLVWNWFDTACFGPIDAAERKEAKAAFGFSAEDRVLVTIGNCSSVKNHVELLQALPGLPRVKYLHVGTEQPGAPERVLARELDLEESVQFAGWMQNSRLALAAADIYVMPSKYEGFSIAALEAIGSGVPCLLAESPGLVDLKAIGLELEYVKPESKEIAGKLRGMLGTNPDLLAGVGRRNAALVRERLNPDAGVRGYAAIYQDLSCPR